MKKLSQFFSRQKERKEVDTIGTESKRGSGKDTMDALKFEEESMIKSMLQEGEQVIFSDNIEKFNRKNKKQKRQIMITNHFVYNLKGMKLKRKIEIQKIKKIITSRYSGEFILNVPDEYDYRYISGESKKQLIIEILCSISLGMQILYADQAELAEVVTTRIAKEQQQYFSSTLYGTALETYQLPQINSDNNSTMSSTQRYPTQNTINALNLSSLSDHSKTMENEQDINHSKNITDSKNITEKKEKVFKKVSSFERGVQMNFSDFEMIEYQGYMNAWRQFRVKECGSESKKMYQMRVINTHTHQKTVVQVQKVQKEKEEEEEEDDLTYKQQFVKEQVQLMKELDSSYFCQQYFYIEQGQYFAILQEELDRSKCIDLSQLIDEQSFLSENIAKVIAAQVAHSLNILHQKKIVYNQVNPQDIKIDLAGNTILACFEFSKFIYTPQTLSPTSKISQFLPTNPSNHQLIFSSSVFNTDDSPCKLTRKRNNATQNHNHGKKDYFSPEMIRGNSNSHNTDWWSFGILLYEMLLGFTPFFHQDTSKMEEKILTQKDIFFPKMANISISAKNLIIKCLDKNPKTRIKGTDILNHEFFTGIKWAEIKERVPQYEISSLFNLENQFSEETPCAANPQQEIEEITTEQINIREDFKERDNSMHEIIGENSKNEEQEDTIILSEIRTFRKSDKFNSSDLNKKKIIRNNVLQLTNLA